jgi:hypothetical protein
MQYLIWSIERRAWWGPRHGKAPLGYTTCTHRAGLYNLEEATDIVTESNRDGMYEINVPAPTRAQVDGDLTADLEWPEAERIGRVDAALAAQLGRSMQENARLQIEISELRKKIS